MISRDQYRSLMGNLKKYNGIGDYPKMYEAAEALFVLTNYPYFYYVCLDCKLNKEIGKDVQYLLEACKNSSLMEFLRGTYFSFVGSWPEASISFRAALSKPSFQRELPLYLISLAGQPVQFMLENAEIHDAAKNNLSAIDVIREQKLHKFKIDTIKISAFEIKYDDVIIIEPEAKYSIDVFKEIIIRRNKKGRVDAKCELIPKDSEMDSLDLKFDRPTDLEFTFLLFLVDELSQGRKEGESWLEDVSIYDPHFLKLYKMIGLDDTIPDGISELARYAENLKDDRDWPKQVKKQLSNGGWWDDPSRRRSLRDKINKKANQKGLLDELVKLDDSNPETAIYKINRIPKAQIIKRP